MVKTKLSAKQYPCCDCVDAQPHSCNDLQSTISLLEKPNKDKGERAEQVVIAFTGLRVIDMIEVRSN